MKFIVILSVLIIKLAHCELITDSENEQNSENNRLQLEPVHSILGLPKIQRRILQLPKKETHLEKQKRRCDICRDTFRCKSQGKCDLCSRICKDLEVITDPPILGQPLQEIPSQIPSAFLSNSDRYYTVRSFDRGPTQDLLSRLLHISQTDKLDKLVVLAKAKGKKLGKLDRTVIIDAANVFNNKETEPAVFKINNGNLKAIDMDLASKIDRELDMAIQRKHKLTGESSLTQKEMDKIIDHALSLFDQSKSQDKVNLQSRFKYIEDEHLTTKRSVPNSKDPARTTVQEKIQSKIKNSTNQKLCEGIECDDKEEAPTGQKSLKTVQKYDIINVPIENSIKPESADQLLEQDQQPLFQPSTSDFVQDQPDDNVSEIEGDEQILTQSVPKNIMNLEDELDKEVGKHLHSNSNVTVLNSDDESKEESYTNEDHFEQDPSKSLNVNQFSEILLSLEKKVEDIANLVKETCGKDSPVLNNRFKGSGEVPSETDKTLKSPLQMIEVPTDPSFTVSQIEGNTVDPSTKPNIIQPHIINGAVDQLEKGTDYLINKAMDLANSLNKNLIRPPIRQSNQAEQLAKPAAGNEDTEDTVVGCSKEESEEYTGVTPPDNIKDRVEPNRPTKSNFDSEKPNLTTSAKQETVGCSKEESAEYIGSKPEFGSKIPETEIDHNKQEKLLAEVKHTKPASEDPEKVGCSKEDSEEYVGETKSVSNGKEDKVGCKKESEEEEYIPMYPIPGGYRESEKKPETKDIFPKHHLPIHIPSLKEILNHKIAPHDGKKDSALQRIKTAKEDLTFKNKQRAKVKADEPKIFATDAKQNSPSAANREFKMQEYNVPAVSESTVPSQTQSPNARQFNFDTRHIVIPFQENVPLDRNPAEVQQHPNSQQTPNIPLHSLPALHQRFGEQHSGSAAGDGFHLHRPKDLPNWPQLADQTDVVGASMNKQQIGNLEKNVMVENASPTPNPFSIFGKVVPQLNNTEISLGDVSSKKVYFVGNGMQLPLNMKKHDDGSLQLSVDIDKLCDTCRTKTCENKMEEGESHALNYDKGENSQFQIEPVATDGSATKGSSNTGEPTSNGRATFMEKELKGEIDLPEIQEQAHQSKKVRKSAKGGHHGNNSNRGSAKREKHQQTLESDLDFDDEEINSKLSELSKRSPRPYFPERRPDVAAENFYGGSQSSDSVSNSLSSFDGSLNKINKNMAEYFNKRQKLEDEYKKRNEYDLVNPNERQDIVRRRLALINNVLNWMKDVSVPRIGN